MGCRKPRACLHPDVNQLRLSALVLADSDVSSCPAAANGISLHGYKRSGSRWLGTHALMSTDS
jgi:hypothetical protein